MFRIGGKRRKWLGSPLGASLLRNVLSVLTQLQNSEIFPHPSKLCLCARLTILPVDHNECLRSTDHFVVLDRQQREYELDDSNGLRNGSAH